MKKLMRIPRAFAALVLVMSLVGCGLFSTVPGDTTADWRLQREVKRVIGLLEASAGGSNPPNVVDTHDVKSDGKWWVETWVVDRSGTRVEYQVGFRPSPRGGTDLSVRSGMGWQKLD